MIIDTLKEPDQLQISLLGVSYFASLVLQKCVFGRKRSFGGRWVFGEGSFYIDVTGNLPPEPRDRVVIGGAGGNRTGFDTL